MTVWCSTRVQGRSRGVPLAPLGAVRAYAAEIPALQLAQFAGGRHDVLNDTMHREVVAAVVSFLDRLNPTP